MLVKLLPTTKKTSLKKIGVNLKIALSKPEGITWNKPGINKV
jgi:hypothetical protein